MLALLPFEPPYMQAAGMRCDFVGHPVVAEPVATEAEAAAFRVQTGIGDAPFVLVLPGSRKAEVARLSRCLWRGAAPSVGAAPRDARGCSGGAGSVADQVIEAVADWPGDPVVLDPRRA